MQVGDPARPRGRPVLSEIANDTVADAVRIANDEGPAQYTELKSVYPG